MIPDVASSNFFKRRRIIETLEDALVLLRFHSPSAFEDNRLNDAEEQLRSASENTLSLLLQDPKIQLWSLDDLTPLAEHQRSKEVVVFAEKLSEKINFIALGIAHLERRAFRMISKHLPGNTFIPGIGVSLECGDGQGEAEIVSEPDGTLTVNGSPAAQKRWLSSSGFTLPAGDPLLELPRLEGYELAAFDAELTKTWEQLLARIRPLLNASSRADSLVSSFGSFVLPLKPSTDGNHLSVSFKHRPGIIYASWSEDDLDVLEAIVHEADHQSLFEIINEGSLFADEPVNSNASFRSPWRKDPRPLSGLFFGFSAFVTVGAFLEELFSKELVKSDRVGKRAVLALERSLDAISTVNSHAVLTERGKQLLEFNRAEARKSLENLEKHRTFNSWREASRERQGCEADHWKREHGGKNLIANRCA